MRVPSRRWFPATGAVLIATLAVTGCMSGSRDDATDGVLNRRPAAYHPEQFPDIPIERLVGYRLTSEDPQVAIAVAGGTLRRLSLVFMTKPGDDGKPPQEELDRLRGGLSPYGWHPMADAPRDEARFTKAGELLVIRASTAGNATIIEFRLEPTT